MREMVAHVSALLSNGLELFALVGYCGYMTQSLADCSGV
jgi:hypothetical protein